MKLYSIKDTKIGAFMSPVKHHNDATISRDLVDAVNHPEPNPCNTHIEDKQLWYLGDFNENTGYITSDPRFVANLIDFKEKGVTVNEQTGDKTNFSYDLQPASDSFSE